MRTVIQAGISAFSIGVLSACGDGGTSSNTPLSDGAGANSACVGDYYRTVTGTFAGRVEYDASQASAEGGSVCAWDVELTIRERDLETTLCELDAAVTSTVEQSVVLPATSDEASECRAEDAVLRVLDPMRGRPAPMLGVDYTLPVRLELADFSPPPNAGPYFGDASTTVRYVRPFGGTLPVAERLAVDEGGITLEQSAPSAERGVIRGRLERVPR